MTEQQIITLIKYYHRKRCFLMESRKRTTNELGAYLRSVLGWERELPKPQRDAIKRRALEIMEICQKWVRQSNRLPPDETLPMPQVEEADLVIEALLAHQPFNEKEAEAAAQMIRLAQQLPIWSQVASIRGFSALGLAVIVAEVAGKTGRNLADYRSPAALWTRMGLGMRDGVRQGGLTSTATKQQWIEHQYNPMRRSRIWNIGEGLIKLNQEGKYRTLYLARKVYETQKAQAAGLQVVPAAEIPANRKTEFMSLGHVHSRAQRVIEKELLKDLWLAWRGAGANWIVQPTPILPGPTTRTKPNKFRRMEYREAAE
jgi:hypothetical protein